MGRIPNQIEEISEHWPRDRKIEALLPHARAIVRRWRIRKDTTTLDVDDLFSIAAQAIIRSVDEYDRTKNVSLIAYSKQRIRWALQEAIRTYSHAPRTMVTEGKTVSWIYFSRDAGGKTLGDVIADIFPDQNAVSAHDQMSFEFDRDRFHQYIGKLPEKHQRALKYYLEHNCTQREVAAYIGVSESRVLQLIKGSIETMKKMCQEEEAIFNSTQENKWNNLCK